MKRVVCLGLVVAIGALAQTPITDINPSSNLLAPGSTSVNLSFTTAQPTNCGYSVGTLVDLASMQPFTSAPGSTTQQGLVTGLSPNPQTLNQVYIQCAASPGFVETLQYRAVAARDGPFPRVGNIWIGDYILSTDPTDAGKSQIFLGPGGITANQAVALRAQNPNVLILPSVNAQETTGGSPVVPDNYLLRDVNGNRIEDWPGDYLLNLTNPAVPAFLAQFAFEEYFSGANLAYDGLFWDNFHTSIPDPYYDYLGVAHQISSADDGIADDPNTLNAAWSQGMYSLISDFNALAPYAYVSGHIGLEPPPQSVLQDFNGESFVFDALHVREGSMPLGSLLSNYNAWFASGRQPSVATIQCSPPSQIAYGYGYSQLENMLPSTVQFAQTYYPNMRFGLSVALMNNGNSIFDFGDIAQDVDWWYDEYDFPLGSPVNPASLIGSGPTANLLTNGGFENGLLGWLLNVYMDGQATGTADTTITADGNASAHIDVEAAASQNWHISFEQDGLALTNGVSYQVQFWARADTPLTITLFSQGGPPNYTDYGLNAPISIGTSWGLYSASFIATLPSATVNDARLQFFVGATAGNIWLDDVELSSSALAIYRRDFTGGSVLLNGTNDRQTIAVEPGFQKFAGSQAPLWQYIVDDDAADFTADASWQVVTYDTGLTDYNFNGPPPNPNPPYYHAWNYTAHLQATAGTSALWNLNIPDDGQYTIQVWLPAAPGASGWTNEAVYEVVAGGQVIASATLDQTSAAAGDGWHTVATVNLSAASAPVLTVRNGGLGSLLADAVYVSSAALNNDGSAVSQVTLGPMDGILLQRLQPLSAPSATVNAVVNAASYQPGIAPAGFVSIFGTGLADSTRGWTASDFTGNSLPTSLDGVSVTIDGIPAYVQYISPTQINALVPDDSNIGQVQVQVTTPRGAGYSGTALLQRMSPAFFSYTSGATNYVAARHLDGALVSPSQPAAPGEIIEVYGTGFGATNPATPTSELVAQAAPLAFPATVTIGGAAVKVLWAGLVSSGCYQVNLTTPNLPPGDQSVQVSVAGFESGAGTFLPVAPQ